MMCIFRKRLLCLICAAAIFAGCFGFSASAYEEPTDDFSEPASIVITCIEFPLYTDDQYIGSGYLVDDVAYIPLLAFTEYMLQDDCEVFWDQETETAVISSEALLLSINPNRNYLMANDRYIYFESGAYNINGTIMVPLAELSKVFGLELVLDETLWEVCVDPESAEIWEAAALFYPEEDLYWLSRVIYAEAGNQPLEGKIAVGNVVLNRDADESGIFNDTVKGVIFQTGQFSVVPTGAIYAEPSEEAVIAAKLALEGYSLVGECKWFLNPSLSSTKWFDTYKTFEYEIADHYFYA